MVGLFDASNNLISAVNADVSPRILAPGESGPVRATLALPSGAAGQIKSYKLYLDALVTASVSRLVDAEKDIHVNSQYLDADGHFHLIGQITNSGTKPIMVSVQATVYTDPKKTAVADSASLDTLIPVAPGATFPFDLTDWKVLNSKAGLLDTLSKQSAVIALRVEPFRTWAADTPVIPLMVIAQPPTYSTQEALFEGQVKNNTGRNIIQATVTVTLRDKASGKIVATGQTSLDIDNTFAGGEAMSYSIALPIKTGLDPQGVEIEISASGQET
jgi:hypothetical protein